MPDVPDWNQQQSYGLTVIVNAIIAPGGQVPDVPIAQYSSLQIFEYCSPSGTAGPIIAQHIQAEQTAETFALDSFFITAELTNNNGFAAVQAPVLGNYLTVANRHPTQSLRAAIYGSNAPSLGLRRYLGYAQPPHGVQANVVGAVNGTIYPCAISDMPAGDQIPNQLALNGLINVSGTVTLAGTFYLYYLNPQGTLVGLPLLTAAGAVNFNVQTYFAGYARFIFIPSANGNLTLGAAITQGPPSP